MGKEYTIMHTVGETGGGGGGLVPPQGMFSIWLYMYLACSLRYGYGKHGKHMGHHLRRVCLHEYTRAAYGKHIWTSLATSLFTRVYKGCIFFEGCIDFVNENAFS